MGWTKDCPRLLRGGGGVSLGRVLIGILSDSHGHADAMAAAVRALQEAGAEYLIHCGDVGPAAMLDSLAGLPAAFVWGNTDWERDELLRYGEHLGLTSAGAMADLTLDGKRIAVIHGHDAALKRTLLEGQEYDYLFQGHTHVARAEVFGRTRIINPGALYRTPARSVATVELSTGRLRFLPVKI